jgi:TolB protein
MVADSVGGGRYRISPAGALDIDPAISADGKRIAFSNTVPNGNWFDLWVMNADGSNRTRLTQMPGGSYKSAWSPDGRKIAFDAFPDLSYPQIYVINADGTGLTRLTNSISNDMSPEWSPDGKRILFSRDKSGLENKGIFSMDPDGSNIRQLTSGYRDAEATWSPDGTRIAFIREDVIDYGRDVFLMNADGTDLKHLTQSKYRVSKPTWAPDGRSIAFATVSDSKMCPDDEGGTGELYPCGTDLRRVSLDGEVDAKWIITSAYDPTWHR